MKSVLDTYATNELARIDRKYMEGLQTALITIKRTLRQDACGAWQIEGKQGHIYSWSDNRNGWLICCFPGTHLKWLNIKKRLSPFCKITQDGDDQGCFYLTELPTVEQAALIRNAIRLQKRQEREYSPQWEGPLAMARERLAARRSQTSPEPDRSPHASEDPFHRNGDE